MILLLRNGGSARNRQERNTEKRDTNETPSIHDNHPTTIYLTPQALGCRAVLLASSIRQLRQFGKQAVRCVALLAGLYTIEELNDSGFE